MEKLVFNLLKGFFFLALAGHLGSYADMKAKAQKSMKRGIVNMYDVNSQLVGKSDWLHK